MKMISRRDFMKASAVVGAAGVLTACGGSSSSTAASSTAASSAAASAAASEAATGSANVGVCIYQFADNFMTLYRTDLEEYLKDKGYSVTIVDVYILIAFNYKDGETRLDFSDIESSDLQSVGGPCRVSL